MNNTYRKYLPYAAAVALFAVLTLIYFRPLLSGKELRQDDIARHRAMSKEIFDHREKHNEEPLWTNSMFGGMPAYQISTLHHGNWIGKLDEAFKLFLPRPAGYVFLYFLGFYILLLCLRLDPWLSLIGAVAYGLSSYFLIIIEAGHNSKANALGYLPALIGGVVLLFNGRRWLGLAVTTLFTAMELNANHVQISYYGYILIGFLVFGYGITAFKNKTLASYGAALGLFLLATLVGVLPNTGNLLTTYEYGQFSIRGPSELTSRSLAAVNGSVAGSADVEKNKTSGLDIDYATQWSYGIGETFTFLIPDFKGGATGSIQGADPKALKKVSPEYREEVASSNAYFGDQLFTSGPVYIGAIVVFLAILGMMIVKHPLKWPVFFATLLTVMLGWGHHFMPLTEFFLHNVPGYNKFRAVSMIMVVAELTLPLLAALAVHEMLKRKGWDEAVTLRLLKKSVPLRRLVLISAGVVGGFCLLCYLAPEMFNDFTATNEENELVAQYVQAGYPEEQVRPHVAQLMPQVENARKAIFRSDAIRSAIFILLALVSLYLYFTKRINRHLFIGSLGLFIAIDLWTVAMRYLNEKSFVPKGQNQAYIAQKSPADEEILRDTTLYYRVLNMDRGAWQDAMTSYYHKSVGGYHGAKLRKYQELIEFHLDKEIRTFYRNAEQSLGSESGRRELLSGLHVINMLNTRYLILPGGDKRDELPLLNTEANGNAWFVEKLHTVPDADAEILKLGSIDTKTEAVVQQKFVSAAGLKTAYPANGAIRLTSYAANRLEFVYNAPAEVFAVFSDIYYPAGWNAYVDGELKEHVGVNYVLRGMELPAGEHRIEFRFEPRSYRVANSVAMAGSALVIVLTAGGIFLHRRNKVIVS